MFLSLFHNKPALVQIMAWWQTGDKPLLEPLMTWFTYAYMHHFVSMSQRVNVDVYCGR